MGLANFKKWSGKEREKSLRLFNKAKKMGLIQEPTKCRICGQDRGILQTHNKNYDITLAFLPKLIDGTATSEEIAAINEVLIPICWRCHQVYHSYNRAPEAVNNYFREIKNGVRYPPVFHHDFSILQQHGIPPVTKNK